MSIASKLHAIRDQLPSSTRLVAVSKNHPVEAVMEAYQAGQRIFGENKAQELAAKAPQCPDDIEWHFIGHLQRNKVRMIIPYVSLIHSVDSLKLLEEIDRQSDKAGRLTDCLLQFHIAEEETKFGLDLAEARQLLSSEGYRQMQHVRITGVMGMATFTEDMGQVRREFSTLLATFLELKASFFAQEMHFREISMGMTNDLAVALQEGSTLVRIGTAIFGER